jgi:hypothetical protein
MDVKKQLRISKDVAQKRRYATAASTKNKTSAVKKQRVSPTNETKTPTGLRLGTVYITIIDTFYRIKSSSR